MAAKNTRTCSQPMAVMAMSPQNLSGRTSAYTRYAVSSRDRTMPMPESSVMADLLASRALEAIERAGVDPAQREERDRDADEHDVFHCRLASQHPPCHGLRTEGGRRAVIAGRRPLQIAGRCARGVAPCDGAARWAARRRE